MSVCVCTYNRAKGLARLLASLESCGESGVRSWELLIVNNNSTDETRQVAQSFQGRLPIRYLEESKQGLSHARNKAIRKFLGDLLIFTDDDIEVDRGWLRSYSHAAREHESAGYFGGRIIPCYEKVRPKWLIDEKMPLLAGLIGSYVIDTKTRPYGPDDMHPYGANFALRRTLMRDVGNFRPDLGVRGEVPGRGEEAEYFQRIRTKNYRGIYLHDAVCYHYNTPDRFKLGFLFSYGKQKGLAEGAMANGDFTPLGKGRTLKTFGRGVYQLFKGRPDRFRQSIINLGIESGLRAADKRSEKTI